MATRLVGFLADVHGNSVALDGCLKDMEDKFGKIPVKFLGDLVGYGPHPKECLNTMMRLRHEGRLPVCILGNHDEAAIFDPSGFNGAAYDAIMWTRDVLERAQGQKIDGETLADRYFAFLNEMKRKVEVDGLMFVHGSARAPTNEYLLPEHIYDEKKVTAIAAKMNGLTFAGHTHVPGIFDLTQTNPATFEEPGDYHPVTLESRVVALDRKKKVAVNIGSVGQPRDGDCRACYAVLDTVSMELRWIRVVYDIGKTQDAMRQIPALAQHKFLIERIACGR